METMDTFSWWLVSCQQVKRMTKHNVEKLWQMHGQLAKSVLDLYDI